jgi:carbon-monoxide dehydrogenase medium subunit
VEASLTGGDLRDDALSAAAAAADGASAPIDDVRGSARYRRAMLPVVTRRALELARARLDGGPKARGAA